MTSNALLRRMGRRGPPRLKGDRQQRYCGSAGVEFAALFDHGQLRPDARPRPRRPVGRRLDHQSPLRRRGRRPQPRRPRHTSHQAIVGTDASRARCPADRDAAPRRLIGRRSGTELGVDRQATPRRAAGRALVRGRAREQRPAVWARPSWPRRRDADRRWGGATNRENAWVLSSRATLQWARALSTVDVEGADGLESGVRPEASRGTDPARRESCSASRAAPRGCASRPVESRTTRHPPMGRHDPC